MSDLILTRPRPWGPILMRCAGGTMLTLIAISLTMGCKGSNCCLDNSPPSASWDTVVGEDPWHYGYQQTTWSSWSEGYHAEEQAPPSGRVEIEEFEGPEGLGETSRTSTERELSDWFAGNPLGR